MDHSNYHVFLQSCCSFHKLDAFYSLGAYILWLKAKISELKKYFLSVKAQVLQCDVLVFNMYLALTKIQSQTKSRELFYLVGMFSTPESERQHLSSSEKTAPRRQEWKSFYIHVCNKGNWESYHPRSDIKLRNLAFCVWEDASLWAHWIDPFHMHLSYLGPILFPCSYCFLHSPSSSAITMGGGVWQQFPEPSSPFGGQKSLKVVTLLVY